ncbi:uncharacterized protein N7482_003344 [Penicillium canariense]|uniref:Uncharacterized protein n=1 Tax=Penicillium canariense TaxID=189055 RepID=A0A9W9I715_9EURO|nr:uncharacterized protein N7482_003344 [Penicillium canariense]KAJ5167750.1 hypothetical protein N7482_003344 [Penicillium canariense]
MTQLRKSYFWSPSTWKLRLKHGSRTQSTTSTAEEFHSAHSFILNNHIDPMKNPVEERSEAVPRYSSSVYSEHEDACSPVLRLSNNKNKKEDLTGCLKRKMKSLTAPNQMAPNRRHSRPYAVSSGEWVLVPTTESSLGRIGQVLSLDDLTEMQFSYHFDTALKVFIKVYAMAKVMEVAFLSYGCELDNAETGLQYWIKHAEAEVRTNSLAVLIEVVENLFYALYSRVIIEMAGIELCALFKLQLRPAVGSRQFFLPDANHMYRLLLACKDNLDDTNVCESLQEGVVHQWQEGFLRRLALKEIEKGFNPDDMLGYRRFAQSIVSDPTCAYVAKWRSLVPFFDTIPSEILAVMSEKWFTVLPKVVLPDDVPSGQLPFVDLKRANPMQWEKEIILDYRLATLGKLEGRSIGEERRDDPKIRLLSLARCRKCICTSVCLCSWACTYRVKSACPCSERHVRIMMARRCKETGPFDFTIRANTAARACWEGLAMLRRDVKDDTILLEWREAFEVFELTIQKERWAD